MLSLSASVEAGPRCAGRAGREEAAQGAKLIDLQHALNIAENPGTRLCTLCGCAAELPPMLSGFDHIANS
ncbi:hypothetical protein ACFU8W_32395 [Streptomyces sp. NPDC057565]|uniref:hypothetical protein n=1 Tax=Streptomyces sp. NPDC057565 TaxID=3346169 RepID=UPI00369B7B51